MARHHLFCTGFALVAAAGTASAQVEPIMYTGGPVPGVPGATIAQTGLYRPAFSPDKSLWVIRVNRSSGNDDEYLVAGSGLTGSAIIHSRGTAAANPAGISSVYFISERGYRVNDSGQIGFSGSASARGATDTLWRFTPGTPNLIEIVAQEASTTYIRPGVGGPAFVELSAPAIANTGDIVFADSDSRTEASDRDVVFRWTGSFNSYTELVAEGEPVSDPFTAGQFIEGMNVGEANLVNRALWYFQDAGEPPIFGIYGDTNLATSADNALFRSTAAGWEVVYREGTTIDGLLVTAPNPSLVGWLDAQGNTYAASGGTILSGGPADMFAFINGELVAAAGEPVGGTVEGELWSTANTTALTSSVHFLDRNSVGGVVIGGSTNNPDLTRNQVVIYVAPDGTRTELLRIGATQVEVDVGGSPQTRTLANISQQDATFPAVLTDTHLYFLAGTTPLAGTVVADLYARIALPVPCPADVDGIPGVDFGDFLFFFNCFDTLDACADIDSEPGVDFGDFLTFFNSFDSGC